MDAERWARIDALYHAARARPPDERAVFLASSCPDDEALRREVNSLLLESVSDDGSLESPPFALAGQALQALLSPDLHGRSLGGYLVDELLGAGGMGEVYRARDARLGRDVAIKILPAAFGQDAGRLARFQREARILAALNHPNICAIYGVEEIEGLQFLVLELVDGPTLTELLRTQAPSRAQPAGLPLPRALSIALQIVAALETAHEKGIVHRDLKPENIKLTGAGVVKVLDFGLAKAVSGNGSAPDLTAAPIATDPQRAGMVIGTAAYMSPEQARGLAVDKRTDIWAFGCVLYQMLSGRAAFAGETVSDTIARVLEREPDWSVLPPETPSAIRGLLARCLTKDHHRRLRDVGEVRIGIEAVDRPPRESASAVTTAPPRATARARWIPWILTGAAAMALAVLVTLWPASQRPNAPSPVVVNAALGPGLSLPAIQAQYGDAAVLSPDGAIIAFLAQRGEVDRHQLYVRRLDQAQPTPLSATDNAQSPFFSPDGRWLAFFAGGKLKKVAVLGGAPVVLADAPVSRGGSWGEDDWIVFSPSSNPGTQLLRVPAAGGLAEPVTPLVPGETLQLWPQVLPGSRGVLFTSSNLRGDFNNADLVVQPLPDGPRKIVRRGGFHGRYVPSGIDSPDRDQRATGHLVYMHDGTLFAAAFDLERLEETGEPVPVLERVTSNSITGGAHFAVARNGALVYLPGPSTGAGMPVHWLDRTGATTLLRPAASNWFSPRFSPDGRRLAMEIRQGQSDIWIYDWARDTLTPFTSDANLDAKPVWTPDGRRLVFGSSRDAGRVLNLHWQRADGTGEPQRLTVSRNDQRPTSWHPAGRLLLFEETVGPRNDDVMMLSIDGDESSGWRVGTPQVLLNSSAPEVEPMFSPDGRWLAYVSGESGRLEVYVQPFPASGAKWKISNAGGTVPTWSEKRREIYYGVNGQIMVVPYAVQGSEFVAGKPQLWSPGRYQTRGHRRMFDLHPDGLRFALASAADTPSGMTQDHVTFIFNFFDELRRLAPAGR
jgi:Tol biopolymer transport system component